MQQDTIKQRVRLDRITFFDVVIIVFILLLSAGFLLRTQFNLNREPSKGMGAAVYYDGKLDKRLDFGKDREIVLLNGKMVIEVHGEKVRVKKSECPRQLCVKTGWIQHPGESIICVPFKTVIEIDAARKPVVDAVVF